MIYYLLKARRRRAAHADLYHYSTILTPKMNLKMSRKKKHSIGYNPGVAMDKIVRNILVQFVFSKLGVVKVFQDPEDAYKIEFYASEEEGKEIENSITHHLPIIFQKQVNDSIIDYLFHNKVFVTSRPTLQKCIELPICTDLNCNIKTCNKHKLLSA